MITLHNAVFGWFQRTFEDWFLGLAARLIFAGTLFVYFYRSAQTKVGEGLEGFAQVQDNAYWQILGEPVIAAFGYDASQVPFWPWGFLVHVGTYAEFVLPVLIVLGFMTRIAAVGMLIFVIVQSYVDINGMLVPPSVVTGQPAAAPDPAAAEAAPAGVDAGTIGAWFDNVPGSVILDQRAFWCFLFLYLALRGAGAVSLDRLFGGRGVDEDDYDDYY